MGKNNYSFLQRQGLSMFWDKTFTMCKNYNKFFLLSFFSEKFISNILKNFFKYNFINRLYKLNFFKIYNKRLEKVKISKINNNTHLLIGKIWIFKVDKWIVISINVFLKNKVLYLKKHIKKKIDINVFWFLNRKKFNCLYNF